MAEQPEAIIGVLGAMPSEVLGLVAAMDIDDTGSTAGFQYWTGRLAGRNVVVARCGMGKVSAAAGVQRLVDGWGVSCIVVCGLAGGLADGLRIGDVVVGDSFVQHDLDASPIFPRFEVPGLGVSRFEPPSYLVDMAQSAANSVVAVEGGAKTVHRGLIVTGDQFISDSQRDLIRHDFPDALCVEMEGGAIAQVCHLNAVDFVIVRVVSDTADGDAPADFLRFVEHDAPRYTVSIVQRLLPTLPR